MVSRYGVPILRVNTVLKNCYVKMQQMRVRKEKGRKTKVLNLIGGRQEDTGDEQT